MVTVPMNLLATTSDPELARGRPIYAPEHPRMVLENSRGIPPSGVAPQHSRQYRCFRAARHDDDDATGRHDRAKPHSDGLVWNWG